MHHRLRVPLLAYLGGEDQAITASDEANTEARGKLSLIAPPAQQTLWGAAMSHTVVGRALVHGSQRPNVGGGGAMPRGPLPDFSPAA